MKVLILNQAFYPDVVSTAQHAADLAVAASDAGHQVTVMAGARGYDNPLQRYPRRETWKGVRILRVGSTGFGKTTRWRRAADFATFMTSCSARLLLSQRFDLVIAMTTPPLISALAALFVPIKARRFVFWCMDLNPDEAIAAGWLRPHSLSAKGINVLLDYGLRKADAIVALDRHMQRRLLAKGVPAEKMSVIPPWSHDDYVRFDPAGRDEFRRRHGLEGKFVVMYSGNHSPCHPLDTLVEAAHRLENHPNIKFCFIGGGSEFRKLESYARLRRPPNILLLPYQPLETLAASLSAADLHVVVMGEPFAGIVHPCKIYNVLAVGSPFLYIGPTESHLADLAHLAGKNAYCARHGDADGIMRLLLAARNSSPRTRFGFAAEFSRQNLLPRLIHLLEDTAAAAASAGSDPVPVSRN
jgi:glycosyltransferase involved in cell wall biosynthesis